MLDIGLLVIRIVVGALLAAHGLQKLAGWFGGPGLRGNAAFLDQLGFRRPELMSRVHAGVETAAGLLLVVGLLTPLAAAALIAVMLVAGVVVHGANGLWTQNGGYEYPLVLTASAAALALAGPGRISLDAALGWQPTTTSASLAIAGGLIAGALTVAARRERPAPRRESVPDRGDARLGDAA